MSVPAPDAKSEPTFLDEWVGLEHACGKKSDAGGEIRTHTPLRAEGFKPPASTVPPPRRAGSVPSGNRASGCPAGH